MDIDEEKELLTIESIAHLLVIIKVNGYPPYINLSLYWVFVKPYYERTYFCNYWQ